jgi:hypothetical protein
MLHDQGFLSSAASFDSADRYRRFMGWPGTYRNVSRAALPALVLVLAACINGPGPPAHPAATHTAPGPVTERLASTGFTIGYDIVTDCHQRHPDTDWPAITAASAATILAGSHYRPCSS